MSEGPVTVRLSAVPLQDTDYARLDGIAAFERGEPISANPYGPRTDSWRAWYRGYASAGLTQFHVERRRAVLEAEQELARRVRRKGLAVLLMLIVPWLFVVGARAWGLIP